MFLESLGLLHKNNIAGCDVAVGDVVGVISLVVEADTLEVAIVSCFASPAIVTLNAIIAPISITDTAVKSRPFFGNLLRLIFIFTSLSLMSIDA